jgi:uncharacterized protein (DUF427 family)
MGGRSRTPSVFDLTKGRRNIEIGERMNGHVVETVEGDQHVRIEVGGQVVAESRRPIVLTESNLPVRYYMPPEDVNFDLLEATDTHTRCPYKGIASYWSFRDGGVMPDLAWAYPDPIPAVASIKDHVAFYGDDVSIVVDGMKQS